MHALTRRGTLRVTRSPQTRRAGILPSLLLLGVLVGLVASAASPAGAQMTISSVIPGTLPVWSGAAITGMTTLTIDGSGFDTRLSGSAEDTGNACRSTYGGASNVPCTFIRLKYRQTLGNAEQTIVSQIRLIAGQGTITPTQIVVNVPNDPAIKKGGYLVVYTMSAASAQTYASATIPVVNPVPTLDANALSISAYQAGSVLPLDLFLRGTGFTQDSVVLWDGIDLGTTGLNRQPASDCPAPPCLTLKVPVERMTAPSSYALTVRNPDLGARGGGTSNAATLVLTNPRPSPGAVSPAWVPQGAPGTTLTITGGNFAPGAKVIFNAPMGAEYTPTSITWDTLVVSIPASEFTQTRAAPIGVRNPEPGGGTGATVPFYIVDAVPTVTSIAPLSVPAGTGETVLAATGVNFDPSVRITWNGTDLPTTWESLTRARATLASTRLQSAGTFTIGARNHAYGTVSPTTVTFTVLNPAPALNLLTPQSVLTGGTPPTVLLTGTGFVVGAQITWGGRTKTPSYLGPTLLSVTLDAADVAAAGTVAVTVSNPAPGGGASAPRTFSVNSPAPVLASVSPTSVLAGSSATAITVTGTGFVPDSRVTWNGTTVPTSFISSTTLTATIPTVHLTASGPSLVAVTTPGPGGGTSSGAAVTVVSPATIQTGELEQAGAAVALPVSWSGSSRSSGPLHCGDGTVLTALPGTCTYTTAGTFTLTGSYALEGTSFVPAPLQVTIPSGAPVPLPFLPTVNGQPATDAVQVYSLPATLVAPVNFSAPAAVGIFDGLDLSRTRMNVIPSGQAPVRLSLTTTDSLHYSLTTPLTTAGEYVLSLDGYTLSGQPVTMSASFTLLRDAVALQLDPPIQSGATVTVPVHFPATPTTSHQVVNCGTTPTQTFTGPHGACVYTRGGTYTVTATFTDPAGTPSVPTAPAMATVAWLPLQPAPLAPQVNGQPAPAVQVYRLPASLSVPIAFTATPGVGILDTLDLSTSRLSLTAPGQTPASLPLSATEGLTYSAGASLTTAGGYTLTLIGRTQSGQTLSASAAFTLAVSAVMLQLDPPVQSGASVTVGVRWPDTPAMTQQQTTCGSTPAQTFSGPTGQCVYSRAGTFTISGTFTDPLGTPNVPTAPSPVAIPVVTLTADAPVPEVDGQPVAALTAYTVPVEVVLPVRFTPNLGLGILDELDRPASSIQVLRDGLPAPPLRLVRGEDTLHYRADASLTTAGTYTFTLLARTQSGQTLIANATFALALESLRLTLDPPIQQDETVIIGVHWPATPAVTDIRVDCGVPGQPATGAAGQCVYNQPGTFTINGRFTDPRGIPDVQTAPATVTIAAIAPIATPIVPLIGGQPAADIQVYTLPASIDLPVVLTRRAGLGILDELDLTRSRIAVSTNGGAPVLVSLTRTDGLHYRAGTMAVESGSYTFTLQGITRTGQAVTTSGGLALTLTPVTLVAEAPVQEGSSVVVPIRWPDAPPVTGMLIDCGTPVVQSFTGPTGTCGYTDPGNYTVRGRFTGPDGTPDQQTAPLPLTVPALALEQPVLVPMLGGHPLAEADVYAFPAAITVPISFTPASGVGVVDGLHLASSRLVVARDGVIITRPLLTATDPPHYTARLSLPAAGAYTFTLEGRTRSGAPVTASVTVPVGVATLSLLSGEMVQAGASVMVPIRWPDVPVVTDPTVSCGTHPVQSFTGPAGECTYSQAGTFTVTGTFTDPHGTKRVSAQPLTIIVPSQPPVNPALTVQLNGQPGTGATVSTTLPAVLDVTVSLERPTAVGILDPLFVPSARLMVTGPQLTPVTVPLTASAHGFALTGQTLLHTAGDYSVGVTALTQAQVPLTAATTTRVEGSSIQLAVGELTQTASRKVEVALRFPAGLPGTQFHVDCGTPRAQIQPGPDVVCTYAAPGTFQATGYFTPPGSAVRVPTEPAEVLIPAVQPAYLALDVTFPGAGHLSETQDSTPQARIFHLTPTTYPVDMRVSVAGVVPESAGVGIATPFDRTSGTLAMTLLATSDGQPVPNGPSLTVPVNDDPVSQSFGVRTTLRGFTGEQGHPRISGRYRLTFTGKLADATPVEQSATVLIDEPLLQAEVIPYGVEGPYAPATYRFRVMQLQNSVKRDRTSFTWTAVRVRPGQPDAEIKTSHSSTTFAVVLPTAGTYRVSLRCVGAVSGSFTWSEQITVPEAPVSTAEDPAPVISFTSGGAQRPPVQYRLNAALPPLEPGDRYTAIEWSMDGTRLQRPANRATIMAPGSHTFQVIARTRNGKEYTASQSVEVRENLVPRGTLDCSKSVPGTTTASLRCSAVGLDPDGRIVTRRWRVEELGIDTKGGWILKANVENPPATITVRLYVTDNSEATEEIGPVTVSLQPPVRSDEAAGRWTAM